MAAMVFRWLFKTKPFGSRNGFFFPFFQVVMKNFPSIQSNLDVKSSHEHKFPTVFGGPISGWYLFKFKDFSAPGIDWGMTFGLIRFWHCDSGFNIQIYKTTADPHKTLTHPET